MREWKKVVLVIKKEDLLFSVIPCRTVITFAWYRYLNQLGLDPIDFDARWLESMKEFKKTWHVTIKFRKKGEWWEYED